MLADGSGLPVYGKIELTGRIRNFPFMKEFLVSRVSDEGILGTAFLASQKCTLCLDRGVLV